MRGRPLQAPPPPLIPGSLSFGPLICSSRTPAQALRVPVIPKAGRKLRQDPGPLLRLPQQQPSRVAGDRSPVKPPPHLIPTQGMKFEAFLVTLWAQKAVRCPP